MNKTSLSALYRRLTSANAPALDAEDIAAAADGTLADDRRDAVAGAIAASPVHARVVRMLRELRTDSEALAFGIARTERDAAHRRHERSDRRIATGRRYGQVTRWATAMAACLVAVVGFWTQRHVQTESPRAHAVAKADRIFTSRDTISHLTMDGPRSKPSVEGDRLFRDDFSGGG
ncbi:MAG TPA: hypothetical protein VKB52_16915 [Rhodanobacteraceae bacterium]|nr:hypothetical protein [Rhodanobacteraceae bacterium]